MASKMQGRKTKQYRGRSSFHSMKYNRSWMHLAQKNQIGEGDINEKYRILILLRDYFGLHAQMNNGNDFAIYINKATGYLESPIGYHSKEAIYKDFHVHFPDLFIKARKTPIIIEIDGPSHWSTARGIKKTNERNEHYTSSDAQFIWMTDAEARDRNTAHVVLNLSERLGLKPSPLPRK